MKKTRPDLSVRIGLLRLQNPVLTASGTFGYGQEYAGLVDLNRLGGIIVKGLSLQPRPGNMPPRTVETPCGLLNAIGLQNVGVENFIADKLPFLRNLSIPVIVNILGQDIKEYRKLAERLSSVEGIAALEVNISCPNVKAGGVVFGTDYKAAARVTRAVRAAAELPIIVKLSPNVTDIVNIARAVEEAGADAVSLINTLTGMAIDVETRRPKLHNVTGGLSGPAIKPVALRMVWQVAGAVKIPVIGCGGIMTAADALEFLIAGACAVQVGTANFVNPRATMEIISGIEEYLVRHNFKDVKSLVGSLIL
ncbi:MAG: dihydroorotate dehydrogenase [Deltaproteobacteria bacterium]|nr:MAG: dihydroorotate dehydrogenase [Deltaproteobacteria bacterium]